MFKNKDLTIWIWNNTYLQCSYAYSSEQKKKKKNKWALPNVLQTSNDLNAVKILWSFLTILHTFQHLNKPCHSFFFSNSKYQLHVNAFEARIPIIMTLTWMAEVAGTPGPKSWRGRDARARHWNCPFGTGNIWSWTWGNASFFFFQGDRN